MNKDHILSTILVGVVIALLLLGLIGGVLAIEADASQDYPLKIYEQNRLGPYCKTYIVIDDETGVNYVAMRFGESMSITPRLNADGSLYVTP